MASQVKAIVAAITAGDLNALSSLPNVRDLLSHPLYGRYSHRSLTLTNPLPLQLAVLFNQRDIVDFLLTNGADPNQIHPQSDSPPAVHIATLLNLPYLLQILVSKSASLELLNEFRLTPLHSALFNSDLQTFQTLVNLGGQVAAVDPNGDTVIHSAIKHQKMMQVQYLAQNPGNLNLVNREGVAAFQLLQGAAVQRPQMQPQMIAVDAGRYEELKNRVTALEFALSRITAGVSENGGNCPICNGRYENAEWVQHVRNGCNGRS
jgi:ankyrin repeat protein